MCFVLSVLFVSHRKKAEYSVLCSILFVSHQEKAEYSGHTHMHSYKSGKSQEVESVFISKT